MTFALERVEVSGQRLPLDNALRHQSIPSTLKKRSRLKSAVAAVHTTINEGIGSDVLRTSQVGFRLGRHRLPPAPCRPSRTSQATLSTLFKPSLNESMLAIFVTHTPRDGLVFDVVGNSDLSCHQCRANFHARVMKNLALGSTATQAFNIAQGARSQTSSR